MDLIVNNPSTSQLQEARQPIASLISKSEKAQQKLAPETWQHAMLQNNLKALYIASKLMNEEICRDGCVTRDDLHQALEAFASMIGKTEQAQVKFLHGTSQYSLLQNRLKALCTAETLVKIELDNCDV